MFINIKKPGPVFLLFLLFVLACDSNTDSNEIVCLRDEFLDNVENTNCLAEELIQGCSVNCVDDDSQIFIRNLRPKCEFIDCDTLNCNGIRIIEGDDTIVTNGMLTDLALDETGYPVGIFQTNILDAEFTCTNLLPQ